MRLYNYRKMKFGIHVYFVSLQFIHGVSTGTLLVEKKSRNGDCHCGVVLLGNPIMSNFGFLLDTSFLLALSQQGYSLTTKQPCSLPVTPDP